MGIKRISGIKWFSTGLTRVPGSGWEVFGLDVHFGPVAVLHLLPAHRAAVHHPLLYQILPR